MTNIGIKTALIALSLTALCACDRRPEGVLSEKETIDVLADLKLAQNYYNIVGPGQKRIDRDQLTQSVLEKHGITQEELDSTFAYYARNIDEYYLLNSKIEKKLNTLSGREEEAEIKNDIWPYYKFSAFFPMQMTGGISFSIPATSLEKGNALEWRMHLSSPEGVTVLLGVEYENGVSEVKNATGSRNLVVNLVTDTALNAKRIFGFLQAPETSRPLWADSIQLIKIESDPRLYTKPVNQKLIHKPKPKPKEVQVKPLKVDSLLSTSPAPSM